MAATAAEAAAASGDGGASLPPGPSPVLPGPFGNTRLSNAHQEFLYNLFTGYASQDPSPSGNALIQQICEDLEPRELVHPMITVNHEMYKKIRFFRNDHGVDTPSTGASGGLIVNRILHTIWSQPNIMNNETRLSNNSEISNEENLIFRQVSVPPARNQSHLR